ncbi:MAG: hypothetical protein JJE39_12125 [Vicinamibacteria bacterium]|nr:hypothetical protein [Vicinamibacteria bacterium]
MPISASPDGHWLLFDENGAVANRQQSDLGNAARRRPHTASAARGRGEWSVLARRKWIAYHATVSSRREIYVAPFPGPGPIHQISIEGGAEPLWSRDGRELFFLQGARLMSVRVTPDTAFSAGAPKVVHEGRFVRETTGATGWSITPDDSRFLRIQRVDPERASRASIWS